MHGDDFIITGDSMQLAWIESRLNEGLILERRAILCPDDGDDKTVTNLNRLVTWVCLSGSRNQIEIAADPRRREVLLAQMNLDGANAKSLTTPAVKIQEWTPQMLNRTSTFRCATMRASYMSINRVDVQQAVKEVRYLVGHSRLVQVISAQRYVKAHHA